MAPKEPTTQVAFRLPDRLLERIDHHVDRMAKGQAGLEFTRADAARSLLTLGLEVAESAEKAAPELESLRVAFLDLALPLHTRTRTDEEWRRLLDVEWPKLKTRLDKVLVDATYGSSHLRREMQGQISNVTSLLSKTRKTIDSGKRGPSDRSEAQVANAISELLGPLVQLRDAAREANR